MAEGPRYRWVIERSTAWLFCYRWLRIRYGRHAQCPVVLDARPALWIYGDYFSAVPWFSLMDSW